MIDFKCWESIYFYLLERALNIFALYIIFLFFLNSDTFIFLRDYRKQAGFNIKNTFYYPLHFIEAVRYVLKIKASSPKD